MTYYHQQPFQGSPLQQRPKGRVQLFSRTFQRGGKNKSIGIGSTKTFEISRFSKCKSFNKRTFSEERKFQFTVSRQKIKSFCKELVKVITNPVFLSYVEGYKILLVKLPSQNSSLPQASMNVEE